MDVLSIESRRTREVIKRINEIVMVGYPFVSTKDVDRRT